MTQFTVTIYLDSKGRKERLHTGISCLYFTSSLRALEAERGWAFILAHDGELWAFTRRSERKKCVFFSQNLKNVQIFFHILHFMTVSVASVLFFSSSQRNIFFLHSPPCRGISKYSILSINNDSQFKFRHHSSCIRVFIKKSLLLENSGHK